MASSGAGTKEKQSNAISIIDAINAINLINSSINLFMTPPKNISFVANNPLMFIIELLNHIGVTTETLKKWLVDFLIGTLPIIEMGVKALLLANLKKRVSCSSDPRIPAKYRKKHSLDDENNTNTNGIYVSVDAIDIFDKLSISPLSDEGRELYFGTTGVENAYQFARAYDFDAFLWFVMHKAKFVNPTTINYNEDLSKFFKDKFYSSGVDGISLLDDVKVKFNFVQPIGDNQNKGSKILPGNTFVYKNGNVISMCINAKYGTTFANTNVEPITQEAFDNGLLKPNFVLYKYITENELVPVSDDWKSANWYGYLNLFKSFGSYYAKDGIINRDYSKEKAICNIQYFENAIDKDNASDPIGRKFLVSILPKPFVHKPHKGEPPWRFIRLLFNYDGTPSKNGKYSIKSEEFDEFDNEDYVEYTGTKNGVTVTIRVDKKTGEYYFLDVNSYEDLAKFANLFLAECYPGLTVYEFNYDYIMSLRLFDPKVVAASLLKAALNTDIEYNITSKKAERREMVRQTVKSIIESSENSESEITDCFYNFSNDKYERLNRIAEEKRLHINRVGDSTVKSNYENVQNILNEYDDNATLETKTDVLTRAINSASVEASNGLENASDKGQVERNFICNIIQNLLNAIVDGILSPKVLMLLQVNQKIMDSEIDESMFKTSLKSAERQLLEAMSDIILGVIKEVIDMVCTELLNMLLKQLEPLKNLMIDLVANEKAKRYRELVQTIINNCAPLAFDILSLFGNQFDNTVITNVDYADIDRNEVAVDKPKTNNC